MTHQNYEINIIIFILTIIYIFINKFFGKVLFRKRMSERISYEAEFSHISVFVIKIKRVR